jgi:hypothetical protein
MTCAARDARNQFDGECRDAPVAKASSNSGRVERRKKSRQQAFSGSFWISAAPGAEFQDDSAGRKLRWHHARFCAPGVAVGFVVKPAA